MIIKDWNYGTDWWIIPSIFVKKTDHIFEFGFKFLKLELAYVRFIDTLK